MCMPYELSARSIELGFSESKERNKQKHQGAHVPISELPMRRHVVFMYIHDQHYHAQGLYLAEINATLAGWHTLTVGRKLMSSKRCFVKRLSCLRLHKA